MPEPQWLDRDLVDELHEQFLRLHGGLAGVRDTHVLEAALASPRNLCVGCLSGSAIGWPARPSPAWIW
jgi:hypothetical protein